MLRSVPSRLAVMMFLQYFGLGAWVVPLTRYLPMSPAGGGLGFTPSEVGYVYMTLAIGGLVAPFVVSLLADRWFAAEKVIAVGHLSMAVLLAAVGVWCRMHAGEAADPNAAFGPLVVLMLFYSVGCQITLTLTNVVSFRNLTNSADSFGYIRLVGTFGWVVASVVAGWAIDPVSADPLFLASAASVLMALFAPMLPHTPPKGYGRPVREVLGLPALKMLQNRGFVVFALVLFLGNMLNQFYTLFAAPYLSDVGLTVDLGPLGTWGPVVIMTIAQWFEIVCMAATPFLVKRIGLKRLMALGLLGWVARNGFIYAANLPLIVVVGLPMHGMSYAFYGMLGAMFVDREAPEHLRAGAQSLVTFLSSGPAVILGNYMAGQVVEANQSNGVTNWSAVWLIPFIGYIVALVAFMTLFKEPPERKDAKVE